LGAAESVNTPSVLVTVPAFFEDLIFTETPLSGCPVCESVTLPVTVCFCAKRNCEEKMIITISKKDFCSFINAVLVIVYARWYNSRVTIIKKMLCILYVVVIKR